MSLVELLSLRSDKMWVVMSRIIINEIKISKFD